MRKSDKLAWSASFLLGLGYAGAQASAEEDSSGLSEVIVTAQRDRAATKTGADLFLTPQNIQVLSGALMRDQNTSLLEDALRNVAGVQPSGYATGFDFFRIRGFDASDFAYLDGLNRETSANIELTGLETVEVLKGPSSSLYGQGSLGGLVNLVSKRPRKDAFFDLELAVGTDTYYKPSVDFGGPLDEDGSLYARLFAVFRREGSFVDHVKGIERVYVAPSLTWEAGEATTITFLARYQDENNMDVAGLPAQGTVLPNVNGKIPYERYIGSITNPSRVRNEYASFGYELRHGFSQAVDFYQNVRLARYRPDWRNLFNGFFLDGDERTFNLYVFEHERSLRKLSSDTGLQLRFATGRVRHHVTTGVEYDQINDDSTYLLNFDELPVLDLFDPDFAMDEPSSYAPSRSRTRTDVLGFYLQDILSLTERLALTTGGRWSEVTAEDADVPGETRTSKFTPRVGLTYQLREGLAPYVSYSRSFNPQSSFYTDENGDPVKPEEGEQYELGLKMSLLGNRLNATAAVYELTRDNVATSNPQDPSSYLVAGRQRSTGFELDSQMQLGTAWQVIFAYAYTRTEVLEDNDLPAGDWTLNVPRNAISAWVRYLFQGEALEGVGLSLGGVAYSKQAGDLPNSFYLPAYEVFNANVTYERGSWRVQLNLDNLLDEEYFPTSYDQTLVMRGDPRAARLTLNYSFF
jgi:iron complex outermembrane receptor protein